MIDAPPRPADKLLVSLDIEVRRFKKSRDQLRNRMREIRNGTLRQHRYPTTSLTSVLNMNRDSLRAFMNGLSEEEHAIIAIVFGSNRWRERYEKMLQPENDPSMDDTLLTDP